MSIIIGSARIDENGKITGGREGDQKQVGNMDYRGEVSLQTFYISPKGWYVLRPKKVSHAKAIADKMITACNNGNIGYDQSNRYGIIKHGVNTKVKTECDCSSLVRQCVKEATGVDSGDFNTQNECHVLGKTGLFLAKKEYTKGMALCTGDILVTKTKGHTVIVVDGEDREEKKTSYYPQYKGNSESIVMALMDVGESNTSFNNRSRIADVNGIPKYTGSVGQNTKMLKLLREGKLIKA